MQPSETDAWLRYFARREAENFGPRGEPLAIKRAEVLGYVRRQCPEAADVIERQGSFGWTTDAVRVAA